MSSKYICPCCWADLDNEFCQCPECGEYVEGEPAERKDWLFKGFDDVLVPDDY